MLELPNLKATPELLFVVLRSMRCAAMAQSSAFLSNPEAIVPSRENEQSARRFRGRDRNTALQPVSGHHSGDAARPPPRVRGYCRSVGLVGGHEMRRRMASPCRPTAHFD